MNIYIIGSLRNPNITNVSAALRCAGHDVFDDWHAAGPEADDYWQKYEQARGRTYQEALKGEAAKNVFQFDKRHLDEADAAVLVAPAGRSGHLELGYMVGKRRPTAILVEADPERWDVMYQFAGAVCISIDELVQFFAPLVIAHPTAREMEELRKVPPMTHTNIQAGNYGVYGERVV